LNFTENFGQIRQMKHFGYLDMLDHYK